MSKQILFLAPYPFDTAPGQRFRYEQYLESLQAKGYQYRIHSFLDEFAWKILYKKGMVLQKTIGIIKGFFRRLALLFSVSKYDFVFIFREASPIGPPIFEWIIAKLLGKKIIYDFDDAIWLPNTSENNRIAAGLKWHSKVQAICKWSHKVSAGNAYLCAFAKQFNPNSFINPTTIDTERMHNRTKDQRSPKVVIGWTGTHSTMAYLAEIVPVLKELEQTLDFEFCVISNKPPDFDLRSLKYIEWNKTTEIEDLLHFNIGIMPLVDDPWANGKCGFKALQYMALGVPALISPVGVNKEIVQDGVNGFLCSTHQDWVQKLTFLINNPDKRVEMGKAARIRIESHYSVKANTPNFLSLFE